MFRKGLSIVGARQHQGVGGMYESTLLQHKGRKQRKQHDTTLRIITITVKHITAQHSTAHVSRKLVTRPAEKASLSPDSSSSRSLI